MLSTDVIYDPIIEIENKIVSEINPYRPQNNKLNADDKRFHDWYRFVLSFPAHLVRKYLEEFCQSSNSIVLDPFCGTGTTLVESKLHGYRSIGIEANPFAHFASATKLNWSISVDKFLECSQGIVDDVRKQFLKEGINDDEESNEILLKTDLRQLTPELTKLILRNSICPLPLHKTLILLDKINEFKAQNFHPHLVLALGKTLVFRISNLKFGPEVGVGKIKRDAPILASWLLEINKMAEDLRTISGNLHVESLAHLGDSRQVNLLIPAQSVDTVITSPPYPNEKDYTRTTRLESIVLGFIASKDELRRFKKTLIRSNTRGVYKDDDDHQWISHHPEILRIAEQIERRRIELKKTSGFERLYGRVTQLYFGGMAKHLKELQMVLKPGARLAYVVGDQASYLRVMIRTGQIIADIAEHLGYKVDRIDLFRTRFATATGEQLREEVVILTWPGKKT